MSHDQPPPQPRRTLDANELRLTALDRLRLDDVAHDRVVPRTLATLESFGRLAKLGLIAVEPTALGPVQWRITEAGRAALVRR